MEAGMYGHWVVASAAWLAVHLVIPISAAPAQSGPRDGQMATGDAWSTREPLIYVPRDALELPDTMSPRDIEVATGDVWPFGTKPRVIAQEAAASKPVDDQTSKREPTVGRT
jgi:hypothetical protein